MREFRCKIRIPLYRTVVEVILSSNMKETWRKEGPKYGDDGSIDDIAAFTQPVPGQSVLIVATTTPSVSDIAHEAVHAAVYILKTSGVKLTDSSEESYAYLVGHIVCEIRKMMLRNKLRFSKEKV
jgi:hypothetical protein